MGGVVRDARFGSARVVTGHAETVFKEFDAAVPRRRARLATLCGADSGYRLGQFLL